MRFVRSARSAASRARAGASVRGRAVGLLLAIGPRLSDALRREAPPRLAARLAHEDDPEIRAKLIEVVASYEYRSPSALNALEAIARRTQEPATERDRAISALARFPQPRALTALAEMVDLLPDALRTHAIERLRDATGQPSAPNSATWLRVLHGMDKDLKKRLATVEEAEAKAADERRTAAERKREAIRKAGE